MRTTFYCSDFYFVFFRQALPDVFDLAFNVFASTSSTKQSSSPIQKMLLIISDGRFNKMMVRRQIHASLDRGIIPTFIIIDNQVDSNQSIISLRDVSYVEGKPVVARFLDDFPFPFYAIIGNIANLPSVVADIVRQWLELLSRK